MFFLSDAICETMLCDVCHRTLSVGPVKVYANRQTKCGRCSQQGDEGVISMYNSIVRQAVFKCINRFDGCRQLLTYAQVADHESTCKSKKYVCPICPGTTDVPTCLMVKHFREYHSDYNLKTPSFWGKLSDFNTETYLYKEKDNLFFIRCAITSACISLKVFYLGDQKKANKMKQKFIVYYGINGLQEIETSKMECVAYGIENVEGSLLSKPQTDIAHIVLELDVLEGLDIFCCSTSELSKQISLADNFLPFGKKIGLPRIISVSQKLKNVGINSDRTCIVLNNKETLIPYCYNCSFPVGEGNFVTVKHSVHQVICEKCEIYYKHLSIKIEPHSFGELDCIMPLKNFILNSCIWRVWGCSAMNRFEELAAHEQVCLHQPSQVCPVPECTYSGKLPDLAEHFRISHETYKMILNAESRSTEHGKTSYIWVQHVFIKIIVMIKGSHYCGHYYSLTIVPCETNAVSKLEPRALLFSDKLPLTYERIFTAEEENKFTYHRGYFKFYFKEDL